MFTKRFALAFLMAVMLMPLTGCGCRRSCNGGSSSFAPPPGCCDKGLPPAAPFVPGTGP